MEVLRNNIEKIEATQKQVTSNGLVLQSYCNSILQQPNLNFAEVQELVNLQTDINESLDQAKVNANFFLNEVNPKMIISLSDLKGYFTVYRMVPATLPENASVSEWTALLTVVKGLSENNLRNTQKIVEDLNNLSNVLKNDANTFADLARKANDQVTGDEGELNDLSDSLKEIDRSIKAQIALTVGESFAIVGGFVLIGMGVATSPVGAELIVGGVVAVTIGATGLAASSIALNDLYKQKNAIFQSQSKLKEEIRLLTGVDSVMKNLSEQAIVAATAAGEMINVWEELTNSIEQLIEDLNNGIISTDEARTFFINSANNEIAQLQETIRLITHQLAGVVTITLPKDETIIDYLEKVS